MSEKIDVLGWFDSFIERNGLDQDGDAAKARATVAELIDASRGLAAVLDAQTEWEDGCCYYNRFAAPELECPMQNMAAALARIA